MSAAAVISGLSNLKPTTMLPARNFLAVAFGLQVFANHGPETGLSSPTPPGFCEVDTVKYTLLQQCPRIQWSSTSPNDSKTVVNAVGKTDVRDGASEEDPEDLATSSFMSFEEWKAMMLQKTGQDPADLKERKRREGRSRADVGPNDILDSWGDEGEIALDFDAIPGKITGMTATAGARSGAASGEAYSGEDRGSAAQDDGMATYRRPKDAGKTCKERFSYASFDGGATILKTSPGAQNPKAILVENKDAYMLFTCSQENKFVIVELSEDILVDTVVLANFEFFSSTIRKFRVSVSDKYPVKIDKWKDIGTFQARNTRDIQSFLIENPKIYAKYIRFEFLSHYGKEYYCPVSLLRVHGTRMLDSWKDVENAVSDDDESAEASYSQEAVPEPELPQAISSAEPEATTASVERTSQPPANTSIKSYGISPWYPPLYSGPRLQTCAISTPTRTSTAKVDPRENAPNGDASSVEAVSGSRKDEVVMTTVEATVSSTSAAASSTDTASSPVDAPTHTKTSKTTEVSVPSSDPTGNKTQSAEQAAKASLTPVKQSPASKSDGFSSKPTQKQVPNTVANKNATGSSSSAAASPTIQESFFKSMTKRITNLEGNVTLSLQYIEEQSKFLQDALQKMERRQIKRVDDFLHNLNKTVLRDIVLTLESHRQVLDRHDRQILALSTQITHVAEDVSFLKVMVITLSVLNVCGLLLMLLSRGATTTFQSGSAAEQWATTGGHFFNTYLGSPRLGPSSPPSARGSPGTGNNTPTQQQRLALRRQSASAAMRTATLHPGHLQQQQQQRSASGPAALTDKVLPLTPTSDVFDRSDDNETGSPTPPSSARKAVGQRSPPLIRVERVEEPADFYTQRDDTGEVNGARKNGRPLIEELPTPLGEEVATFMNGRDEGEQSEDDEEEEGFEGGCEPSKPPLTRSPLSELGGSSRKPLPALPEDPV